MAWQCMEATHMAPYYVHIRSHFVHGLLYRAGWRLSRRTQRIRTFEYKRSVVRLMCGLPQQQQKHVTRKSRRALTHTHTSTHGQQLKSCRGQRNDPHRVRLYACNVRTRRASAACTRVMSCCAARNGKPHKTLRAACVELQPHRAACRLIHMLTMYTYTYSRLCLLCAARDDR